MNARTRLRVTLAAAVLAAACTSPAGPDVQAPATAPAPSGSAEPGPALPGPDHTAPGADPAPGLPPADRTLPALALEEVVLLEAPIDTALLPDGTVLIAERAGRVRVLDGATPGRVVVDVSARTTTDGERGLLGIAVAPDGRELVLSLTDADGDTLVEAHPLSGSTVVGPPRVLYALPQPFANHNGGPVLFLPDGTLLLGLGDGGGAGDPLGAGQDRSTPLGALVRLDVRGGEVRVPSDNPFVGIPDAAPEVAATGLRNPWRMTLDEARGELWIADVGQSAREEINRVEVGGLLGANFGWALREGTARYLGDEPDGHVAPVHDYAHGPGCSVTGGVVVRGAALAELAGAYLFADLCDGRLRVLVEDADGTVGSRVLDVEAERPIAFGVDADGAPLVLELGGRVLRLVRR